MKREMSCFTIRYADQEDVPLASAELVESGLERTLRSAQACNIAQHIILEAGEVLSSERAVSGTNRRDGGILPERHVDMLL